MGLRYVAFRSCYEVQKRIGLLKIRFPKHVKNTQFVSLDKWREIPVSFFKIDKNSLKQLTPGKNFEHLKLRAEAIQKDQFQYFGWKNHLVKDWHTNPETDFKYNSQQHWSEIPDFSTEAGDIKYVWEGSRFTFLYDLIRYDFHFQQDQSVLVFDKIENWIDNNPVNCGPNWKCSQEITIRILNWTFALHYYKNSASLIEPVFNKIINSIYRQTQHVEENINFSRIAVRNNHALTETLGLYLIGLLYPFFPESKRWKGRGKNFFEQEIAYQIYEDGTFLQFSMNYHRVVIQLLNWAIHLAELNGERWSDTIYDRARKSIHFLRTCQADKSGWLPNYGNNDGALFFPLTDCHFRDFRPQLNALANLLHIDLGYGSGIWQEETFWMEGLGVGGKGQGKTHTQCSYALSPTPSAFSKGGYYLLRDADSITFLRSGNYKDRPFQADNLHLDIWVNGENILRDAGSYKYNADETLIRYFMGTASHNTVMLGDYDQMRKGTGFVWYDWITRSEGEWTKEEEEHVFDGYFEGFKQLGKEIVHRRRVRKKTGELRWEIEDWIENVPVGLFVNQIWHPSTTFFDRFKIMASDEHEEVIRPNLSTGWYSDFYGKKEENIQIVFSTTKSYLKTVIEKVKI